MEQYRPFDVIHITNADDEECVLSAVREAFRKLDCITKRNISDCVIFEGKPFPWQRLERPYDMSYYGPHVKWMRIFRQQSDKTSVKATEEAVIDMQEEPLRVSFDTQPERLGYTVYAVYQACCIALLAKEKRPSRYRNNFSFSGAQEEYIQEACGIVREELLQNSFPYLERISIEDGSVHLAYQDQCRMDTLLYHFSNSDLQFVKKLLRSEYAHTIHDEFDSVIRQAVEDLKSLPPEPGSLCAVPFNNGLHGRSEHGYPRICFAGVEPDTFLREFHPRTDFDLALGRLPLSSEDPTGDENVERILRTAQKQERIPRNLPENVLFFPADRGHYEQILGLDVTCLSQTEKSMMLAELVLTETLSLLGGAVKVNAEEKEALHCNIVYQLSALYLSLRGHRNAEKTFSFEKSSDAGKNNKK